MADRYTRSRCWRFRASSVRFRTAEWRKRTGRPCLLNPAAVSRPCTTIVVPSYKEKDTLENEPDFDTYWLESADDFLAVFVCGGLPRDSWQGNSLQRGLFPRDLARWNASHLLR